jgi:hypothetical protein
VSRDEDDLAEEHIRVVRTGHGANCSSIGSVIDTLFATATVGAAVFAAVLGALKKESITIVGAARPAAPPPPPPPPEPY